MKSNHISLLFLCSLSILCVAACNSNKNKATDKTPHVTKIDTLKKAVKPWSSQDAAKAAEAKFDAYLPTILAKHDAILDVRESHTGDFTGDGVDDVVIYFNLSPKDGGNAVVDQGLVLYKNTGSDVVVVGGFEPGYLFTFEDITDGKIHVEKLEYAAEDGFCCPSIKTAQVLNIDGDKITAVDAN